MDKSTNSSLAPLKFKELVAFTAGVMALNALAIDMMLPALGIIGDELNISNDNDRQLLIIVYIIGTGVAQLFFGPIVDRFGRRKVLLLSLCAYVVMSLVSIVASTFSLLLIARALQGVTTAAARVAMIACVRDQVSGRRMAEVMSLALTIFMAAPILAPAIGQIILFAAPWRGIFVALLIYAAILAACLWARLPETLAIEKRAKLQPRGIIAAYTEFITNRTSVGYTLVAAACFGALLSLISSSEQIFLETFALGDYFALAFAGIAGALACATLFNAKLVGRIGMRRICHGALVVFLATNIVHLIVLSMIGDNLAVFMVFMCISFFTLGLISPNCGALAMEPMGHIAGAAAAANGFASTTLAGILGAIVGRTYDGSTTPIIVGFVALGVAGLLAAYVSEKGQLFGVGHISTEAS